MKKLNKIRLRTKIELCVTTLLLIIIILASAVTSVDRTISNTHDDIYTFICNSNGNYWEATDDNIQAAIDDLNGTVGGWVRLPATTIDVDRTIWVNNCSLYMYGATLNVLADVNVIVPAKRNYTTQGINMEIAGGTIDVSYLKSQGSDFTKACIFVDNKWIWYQACLLHIHDITILGDTNGWIDYSSGAGVEVYGSGDGNVFGLTVSDCTISNFKYGIWIHNAGGGDYGLNGNRFSNIYMHNCVLGIVLEGTGYIDQNMFTNMVFQGYSSITEEAIRVVDGSYNYFQGTVFDSFQYINGSSIINLTSGGIQNTIDIKGVTWDNIVDNQDSDNNWIGDITWLGNLRTKNITLVGNSGGEASLLSTTHINPTGNYGRWASIPRWSTWFYRSIPDGKTSTIRIFGSPNQYLEIQVNDAQATLVTQVGSNGNIILNPDGDVVTIDDVLHLKPRASAPSAPTEGDLYVNSDDHHIYCYLSGAWAQLD